jgi:uncharacterized lipoprotein
MRLLAIAAAAFAALILPACKSTQPTEGGGTASFHQITGTLNFTVEAPLDRVWGAAQAAVDELQFRTTGKSKDAIQGILNAKAADDSTIKITVEKRTDRTTDVTVGVGPFGKEATARLVGDKIRARL